MAKAEDQELNAHTVRERGERGKVQLGGMDPRKTFYMGLSVGNLDGSVADLNCGGGEGVELICETEERAFAEATDFNENYPTLEVWVFKCVPVARVWRGKTRVTRFK